MGTLQEQIREWKEKRNAVILAHNYVDGEIQDIADFVGDSLELSIRAKESNAPVIVFCGVSFMAETAKVLSPKSTVLLPVPDAGCPMADMADGRDVAEYRKNHPETVLVAYVNTTAAAKAEVDICCTSANAEKIVAAIDPEKEIMFLPDRNLGANVAKSLGRRINLWDGCCPTHNHVSVESILENRKKYPDAVLMVHPECQPEVVALADYALSTGGMLRKVRELDAKQYLVGTEHGILHRMQKENPDKEFIRLAPVIHCSNMKKITLESILDTLKNMAPTVDLPEEMMDRARRPIDAMLELSAK